MTDSTDSQEIACSICQDTGECNDISLLPCGHIFHSQCLVTHFITGNMKCPICRYDFTNHNQWIDSSASESDSEESDQDKVQDKLRKRHLTNLINRKSNNGVLKNKCTKLKDLRKNISKINALRKECNSRIRERQKQWKWHNKQLEKIFRTERKEATKFQRNLMRPLLTELRKLETKRRRTLVDVQKLEDFLINNYN